MSEPFDILKRIEGEPIVAKMQSKAIELTERALTEWKNTCPGAGWEHHTTNALVSLCMTPAMQKLLQYAAVGIAAEAAQVQRPEPASKLEF